MSKSLLYPMTVSAKVVRGPVRGQATYASHVPSLGGVPFNREAGLEPGIHVHWALPDALTSARLPSDRASGSTLFPGVPDLWLVVRLNPGASSATPFAKRTAVAWVVDSVAGKATPLATWTPPTDRVVDSIHTLPGMLPHAASASSPGWGLFETAKHEKFEPATAAYYPAARGRFGFYDALDDLKGQTQGNVTYFVVGWYWDDRHDPLAGARQPSALLKTWKSRVVTTPRKSADLGTAVVLDNVHLPQPVSGFNLQSDKGQPLLPAKRAGVRRGTASDTIRETLVQKQGQMTKLFAQFSKMDGDPGVLANVGTAVNSTLAPRQTICHGSVVGVPLKGSTTAPAGITDAKVQLFPNVKRAMASLASLTGAADQVDALEMLLDNLEGQKNSLGGVLDLPGAAHACTFQSVPGKPQYFARIEIEAGPAEPHRGRNPAAGWTLAGTGGSGQWPVLQGRSQSVARSSRLSKVPASSVMQRPFQIAPAGPGPDEIAAVRTAFAATLAAAKDTQIDPRMVSVHDSRPNARSAGLGPTANGAGSDGAGWWLDINDTAAITQLLKNTAGARVGLPTLGNLYTIPGPRWYRPWSPQIVLSNVERSYKFGADHRFHADGTVKTRVGGDTVRSLTVGNKGTVLGADLLAQPDPFNVPGLPGEVISLLHEALLLDTESAGAMAAASGTAQTDRQETFTNAIYAVKFSADPTFSRAAFNAVSLDGTNPSPIAVTLWSDPVDPLFIDSKYTQLPSSLDQWNLDSDHGEFTAKPNSQATPTAGSAKQLTERSLVTSAVVDVLKSAMLTRRTLDPSGNKRQSMVVDKSLTNATFDKLNVISAPLTRLDSQLFALPSRLRAGALRIDSLEVVDMFGFQRAWTPHDTTTTSPHWIPLPPRLPYWSRLQFRLQAEHDVNSDASTVAPPVVGLLLPDFVDHSLEVFDAHGVGIGQLTTDRAILNVTGAGTLGVRFTVHPWLPQPAHPLDAITNKTLQRFVASVVAQTQKVTEVAHSLYDLKETGLSAMLRVIDTIRGTLDPNAKTPDRKVSLIGEPILVLGARLLFEATGTDEAGDLTGDPPPLTGTDMPALTVRIGDITRPDDGVLGCFILGPNMPDVLGRFAPVTKEAAEKATVNYLTAGFGPADSSWIKPATHDFVKDQESKVTLKAGEPREIVILADIRGGIYATCGALPRKKITLPKEFIDAAVRDLEPSFHAGPVLATQLLDSERVLVPPPDVPGYTTEFVYKKPHDSAYSTSEVPPMPPVSELPKSRVLLTEGWLRISASKPT